MSLMFISRFRHLISASGFILWNLLMMTSQYCGSNSIVKFVLHVFSQAINVLQLHQYKSTILSAVSLLNFLMNRSFKIAGFCVGWTLDFVSSFSIPNNHFRLILASSLLCLFLLRQSSKLLPNILSQLSSMLLSRTIRLQLFLSWMISA